MSKRKIICICLFFFILASLHSQEALKSIEEDYFNFLSIQGKTERPTLNYRTLSDSDWKITQQNHIWENNNLGSKKNLSNNIKYKIFGPEWKNSFNTASPYGQNDGGQWQGKGYNTSLSAGARIESKGFEITIKPQLSFSQNLNFDYITPAYNAYNYDQNGNIIGDSTYKDKASEYGYYGLTCIDAPQRFGDKSFWMFDWGDTEIRYTYKTFTLGVGTQIPWLGPVQINPILHSNNAPSYPKFDIGFRKTKIHMPYFGWNLGELENRNFWGILTESEYFDKNKDNNHNLIAGLSLSWSLPWIFEGFTLGLNRTLTCTWDDISPYSAFRIFVPKMHGGEDNCDQRVSFTFDYVMPNSNFELYLEWARNDFSPNMDFIIRYPFHTQGWTFGAQKIFTISENYKLQILLELTHLECSADYDRLINWTSTFYAHHEVTQGYTNKGQWLGAGIGTGGNSQYLGVKVYHKKGSIEFFINRNNPDLDYTMYIDSKKYEQEWKEGKWIAESNIRCFLHFGLSSQYFFNKNFSFQSKYVFTDERNPLNKSKENSRKSERRFNNHIELGIKYNF